MVCVYCDNKTRVVNSRWQKRRNGVWRRRQCKACFSVFSTSELPDFETVISVQKPSKVLEPFSYTKLLLSIYSSLRHRQTAAEDARVLVFTATKLVIQEQTAGLIKSEQITNLVHETLHNFDTAAAIHYKAFHDSSH